MIVLNLLHLLLRIFCHSLFKQNSAMFSIEKYTVLHQKDEKTVVTATVIVFLTTANVIVAATTIVRFS